MADQGSGPAPEKSAGVVLSAADRVLDSTGEPVTPRSAPAALPILRDAAAEAAGDVARRLPGPDALVDAFLEGRAATTFRAYDGDLRHFAAFLGVADSRAALAALVQLGAGGANRAVLMFRNHMAERRLSAATIKRRLAAIRSAVKVARLIGLVEWSIDVGGPKVEDYRDTRGPGVAGWRAIQVTAEAHAELGRPQALRDLAIVELLRGLGLRRGELAALDVEHLELGEDPPGVWVRGKGRQDRERLTLPPGVLAALVRWLEIRGPDPGPVFIRLDKASDPGRMERLSDRSIGDLVPALAHRAGLRRRVRPHGLRHEAITTLLDLTGGDVRAVQRFSRHRDLRTLLLYDDRRRDGAGDLARLLERGTPEDTGD